MFILRLSYCVLCMMIIGVPCCKAQNADEQAVVTIIGDDLTEVANTHDFIITNPSVQYEAPPTDQKIINDNQKTITPSLENGFHMRFEITSSQVPERLSGGAAYVKPVFAYEEDNGVSEKKKISFEQRRFNTKKKLRSWLPKRKKKYRPTLCGRF